MPSRPSGSTLHLARRPSRWLAALLSSSHLAAILALWLSALPEPLAPLGSILLILHLGWLWPRQVSLGHPSAIRRAVWQADGSWRLIQTDGRAETAGLRLPCYTSRWLAVLRFRGRTLVLPRDGMDANTWRRLRVRLLRVEDGEDTL